MTERTVMGIGNFPCVVCRRPIGEHTGRGITVCLREKRRQDPYEHQVIHG